MSARAQQGDDDLLVAFTGVYWGAPKMCDVSRRKRETKACMYACVRVLLCMYARTQAHPASPIACRRHTQPGALEQPAPRLT